MSNAHHHAAGALAQLRSWRFFTAATLLLGLGYYLATNSLGPLQQPQGSGSQVGDLPSLPAVVPSPRRLWRYLDPPRPLAAAALHKGQEEGDREGEGEDEGPDTDKGPGRPVVGGKTSPDGVIELTCDLPAAEKKKNVGGRDGAGLCVFTSIEYCGRWQNESELYTFQDNMRHELGGGYPSKVDVMMKKYAPDVKYVQHEGGDEAVLTAALSSGRMAGVTYNGHDPHYGGSIAHMVALVCFDRKSNWATVSDNNYPGDNQFVWMSCDEFLTRWKGNSGGWAVILLKPPPPAPPQPF